MDFVQAKIDILNWITGFVERPNDDLGGWEPCPHARKARLQGQLDIRKGEIDPYTDLMHTDQGEYAIVGYVYDPVAVDAVQFKKQIHAVNQGFLIPKSLIALADHPCDPRIVNGVTMNQGTWAIAFVLPLNKLNEAASNIAANGYYDNWSADSLRESFEFRPDPRRTDLS